MSRGKLTEQIQELAKEFLGREIDETELRLYPYIDYCLKNCGYYDRNKMSGDERQILMKLKQEKHIEMDGQFHTTSEFYGYLQAVLWIAYVETKIERGEE